MSNIEWRGPSYQEIVEGYGLAVLSEPADLQLTLEGNIAQTPDGDLRFGSIQFQAMMRLVHAWRFGLPTLRFLFETVRRSFERERELADERDAFDYSDLTKPPQVPPSGARLARWFELADEQGVAQNARHACGGAAAVMVQGFLARYRSDLTLKSEPPNLGRPEFAGHSFGAVLQAAANNFRHHDEWARTRPPSERQLGSMVCLVEVLSASALNPPLGGSWVHAVRRNVCGEVLMALTGGRFEALGEALFAYAKDVAAPGMGTP